MKYSFRFEMTGREMNRDDFLSYCIYIVTVFLRLPERIATVIANDHLSREDRVDKEKIFKDLLYFDQRPIRLFLEIFKNIYDHNGGWGYAEFTLQDDDTVSFRIGNLTNPNPENNEHQSATKVNFGLGLDPNIGYLISKRVNRVFTEFSLDINQGYLYTGSYKKDSA